MHHTPLLHFAATALLPALLCGPARAEPPNEGGGISHEQAGAMLEELKQIRLLLQRIEAQGESPSARPAPPKTAGVSVKDSPVLGKADAPVTLVELVDYQCPFCQRFFKDTYPTLKQEYVDTGKLRILVKDMPLGFHKEAPPAAHAARCAGDQGQYWAMHDRLFETGKLAETDLGVHAEALGLDRAGFDDCMRSGRHMAQIDRDTAEASEAGISGTPSFIVAATAADRVTGSVIRGALPTPVFTKHIEQILDGAEE